MQGGKHFLKGALILSVAGIVVKILGAVYRIPLYSILGPEGMGLFQAVYPIYGMMLSISIIGLPIAVSKLVAEKIALKNYGGALQIFKVSIVLITVIGLFLTVVLMLSARYYVNNILQTPDVLLPLLAISPAIIFFALNSAFRGFFQGQQQMLPTAMSKICDQFIRVIAIFIFSSLLVGRGLQWGAAGAAFGTVIGAAAALVILLIIYYKQKANYAKLIDNNYLRPARSVVKEIFMLALPITLSSMVLPMANSVDSIIILPRLQTAGFTALESLKLFGNLTGAAMPLIVIPSIFTGALATSLIPTISNAKAKNNLRGVANMSRLAIRIGLMIGLPAAAGLVLLARPISIMLFNNIDVAYPLAFASVVVVFLLMQQTTTPILQGLGLPVIPVWNAVVGLVIKVALTYTLTAITNINILGPIIGTIAYFGIASLLNIRAIKNHIDLKLGILQSIVKPICNTIIMCVAVFTSHSLMWKVLNASIESERFLSSITVLTAILIGLGVYGISTLLTGTITRGELLMIPGVGVRIESILSRFKTYRY